MKLLLSHCESHEESAHPLFQSGWPDYDFFDGMGEFDKPEWPKMHFIEQRYANDPTNWWVPNEAASAGMLRSAGFEIVEHPEPEVFLCRRGASPKSGAVYPAKGNAA